MKLIRSIVDFRFYKEIYKTSVSKNISYLIVLSLIIYIVGAYASVVKFDNYIRDSILDVIERIPAFKLQNGLLEVYNQDGPYISEQSGKAFVIDTKTTSGITKYNKYSSLIFFDKDGVTFKNHMKFSEIKYKKILGNFKIKSLDKKLLIKIIPVIQFMLKKYVILFYILGYVLWLPFFKLFSIITLSWIAIIISKIQKTKLEYGSLFNISIFAITLPWIIKLMYETFSLNAYIHKYIYYSIYWGVATIYVYMAIKYINLDITNSEEISLENSCNT